MSLTYKEDWEEAKARLHQWWHHEYFGLCALAVTAPRDNPPARPALPPPPPSMSNGTTHRKEAIWYNHRQLTPSRASTTPRL